MSYSDLIPAVCKTCGVEGLSEWPEAECFDCFLKRTEPEPEEELVC